MISSRKNRWLIVLVVTWLGAAAWAGEPNETPLHLEFEVSPTPRGPYSASKPIYRAPDWRPFAAAQPAYAADIAIVGPTRFLPFPRRGMWETFIGEFAMGHAGLSDRQKALLTVVRRMAGSYPRGLGERIDPNQPEHLLLYAVSLEDARKMAQAYFQFAGTLFRQQIEREEGEIRQRSETVAWEEKRVREVDKLFETTQKSWDDLVKIVPYRAENEARDAIGELDRMLNAAQVDIAGIEAKIAALKDYRGNANQDVKPKLDVMMVDELVTLRGAEARRQMATRLRTQANQFLDLKVELANVTGEKQALPKRLAAHRRELSDLQDRLKFFTKDEEPRIPGKVVIRPIQWADEPPAN